MSVDYNLVILGGSLTARYAARVASQFNARVALVEPRSFQDSFAGLDAEGAIAQMLQQAAQRFPLPTHPSSGESSAPPSSPLHSAETWGSVRDWMPPMLAQQWHIQSLESLAMQGVDVVVSDSGGEFCRRPRFGVVADKRLLRSHAYLLAPASTPHIPNIAGLSTVPYLTVDDLLTVDAPLQGKTVVIGDGHRGIEVAQALARLGLKMTLVLRSPESFQSYDWDVKQGILALLEASGVEVLTNASLDQVSYIDEKPWIQVGNRAIATDYLMLATDRRPDLTSLNLEAADIRIHDGSISVNRNLRTSNPRIYACGEGITSVHPLTLAQHQAELAVKNALFLSTRRYGDRPVPVTLHTTPPVASVGLTEADARRQFGNRILVLQTPMHEAFYGRIEGASTGFVKLIVTKNGRIIGAHGMGWAVRELMGAIALAMHNTIPLPQLVSMPLPSSLGTEVLSHLVDQWHTQRLAGDRLRFNLLELFMNWQRDWSRG